MDDIELDNLDEDQPIEPEEEETKYGLAGRKCYYYRWV